MKTKKRIAFMGYGKGLKIMIDSSKKYFEIVGVFTQTDKFYDDNYEYFNSLLSHNLYIDIRKYCKDQKINMFQDKSVSTSSSINWFKTIKPDIIICFSLWEIVGSSFLSAFKNVFNIHGSNIPNLMGRAPQSWAILNKIDNIGYTIHRMTLDVDAGPIASQFKIPVLKNDNPISIIKRQEKQLPLIAKAFYKNFLKSNINYENVNIAEGNYWPRLNTEIHGQINWNMKSNKIERFVRAFSHPFKGAWTFYKRKKMHILKVYKIELIDFEPMFPGMVYKKSKEGIYVTTKDGSILVKNVFFENLEINSNKLIKLGQRFYYSNIRENK